MHSESQARILLITRDRGLIAAVGPVVAGSGARATILSGCSSSDFASGRNPTLVLLDAELPELDLDRILASAREAAGTHCCRIVLISDSMTDAWNRHLAEGALDDLIPRATSNSHWRARLEYVLRATERLSKLDRWHDGSQFYGQLDPLTGLFNRSALLAALFRETDRVQRSRHALSLILFEIDDFDHWKSRFADRQCKTLVQRIVEPVSRMLRSYDTFGRAEDHQFLLILPGCSTINANLLAERLRAEVLSLPFGIDGETIRLSACFGIAASDGRSPVVVLHEAEMALHEAQQEGPDSMKTFARNVNADLEPIEFLS